MCTISDAILQLRLVFLEWNAKTYVGKKNGSWLILSRQNEPAQLRFGPFRGQAATRDTVDRLPVLHVGLTLEFLRLVLATSS